MAAKRKRAGKARPANKRKAAKASVNRAIATAPARSRTPAVARAPLTVCRNIDDLQAMLAVVRDRDKPIAVRLAALQSIQAASFSAADFATFRGDYIAGLREVADDKSLEMRQRVFGILMREKDGFAQQKLLDGLKDPAKALLPPEKALQLLSYDIHGDIYRIARSIVRKPPNDNARREALRLLAADAKAAPIFEKLLRDKKEKREIRQVSAAALQTLRPQKLQKYARNIVMDKSDYDDIKATSLTALTHFGSAAVGRDKALRSGVDRLKTQASAKVKRSARQFLSKYDA